MTDVEIRYDGQDITAQCVIAETRFVSRSGGLVGEANVVVSDVTQSLSFTLGKTLELYLDGQREWDGYIISKNYEYWFAGHTANCRPCPHITPRRLVLVGADRNVLFTRRVLSDAANPTRTDDIYAAGTNDSVIIDDFITNYLNPHDGIDYSTKVETVASPDPYSRIDLPGPSHLFGDFMRELSQATGAVFYIDPDRYLIYSDVNTETAPFVITDNPSGAEVGCREVEILHRADEMINDAMIWGAGQGSDSITFARVQDAASIALHGRWQNQGGFRYNLFRQESANRIAESIVYGSPSSKRGHKDDAISVRCTIFTPGLRVSDKVRFRSDVFDFEDVIPVREMAISFHGPTSVQYDLNLSHEIDEPWTTVEYWWPGPSGPGGEPPGCPVLNCSIPKYAAYADAASTFGPVDAAVRGSHRSLAGSAITWAVKIEAGKNIWFWRQTHDYSVELFGAIQDTTTVRAQYTAQYLDEVRYSGITSFTPINIDDYGERVWHWFTDYFRFRTPLNVRHPGLPIRCRLQATLEFRSWHQPRLRVDDADSGDPHTKEHVIQILRVFPGTVAEDGLTAYKHFHPIGLALLEGEMVDGDTVSIDITFVQDPDTYAYIAANILEAELDGWPIVESRATLSGITITYQEMRPDGSIAIPGCQPIPICGPSCVTATRDHDRTYAVPVAYIPGSLELTMNGLPLRWGSDFTETFPLQGQFELSETLDTSVFGTEAPYACFDGGGLIDSYPPPTEGALFILPVTGSITGTFGAQTSLWGPAVWHGTYYEHFHNGVDFGVPTGTLVYAAADGEVAYEDQEAGGTMIHIYHANGMRTTYAHLSERLVSPGQDVSQGTLIARSGASGDVTGAHLHWGMVFAGSPEDPLPYTSYVPVGPV